MNRRAVGLERRPREGLSTESDRSTREGRGRRLNAGSSVFADGQGGKAENDGIEGRTQ